MRVRYNFDLSGLICFFLFLTFTITCSLLYASENKNQRFQGESNYSIMVNESLLSIEAVETDLRTLLLNIAKKTGLKFSVDEAINETVTVSLKKVKIEDAIKQLCPNWEMVFETDQSTGEQILKSIGVYSSSKNIMTSSEQKTDKSLLTDRSANPEERYQAIKTAWKNDSSDVLPGLRKVLNDSSEHRALRLAAVRSLVKIGDPVFINDVRKVLDSTEDNNFSYGLAMAIGKLDHVEAVSLLSDLAEKAANSTLRYKAVQSLMMTKRKENLDIFKKVASQDPDKFNRAKAVMALGETGDENIAGFIKELRSREKDDFVKNVCEKQIRKLENL